jgi:hypothetical protein
VPFDPGKVGYAEALPLGPENDLIHVEGDGLPGAWPDLLYGRELCVKRYALCAQYLLAVDKGGS